MDRAAALGIEYFFVGADWVPEMRIWGPYQQNSSPGKPWSYPVDPEIFPSKTLRRLSDYVQSLLYKADGVFRGDSQALRPVRP